ncbi:chromate resistance protein ChrB domain-containing protein [Noviherbaspirillum malthae]|uniref:chromate resistance protein ChrB domain-containing protein n=1 Tax=Noviherbaspirillum malthae TaxID=1260987 RepID=UPI00188F4809|nr:chromate resistance protein ChrB domain-containing protein [Noviherbaspirillum malthae]
MNYENHRWLLLIASLPTSSATARMRLWRAIKALGCVALRDGAYLLLYRESHAEALADLAAQTNNEGGQAWVVDVAPRSAADNEAFQALFDRSSEYAQMNVNLTEARKALTSQTPAEIAKALKRLRKERDALVRIDFFPNRASLDAEAAWGDFEEAVNASLSPGEPHAQERPIPRLSRADYQGRTWATRRNLWVDRVASAWLIRRFIDSDAKFLWLDSPAQCPKEALGFDFDDAAFTHVNDKVTFEVLLVSFNIEMTPSMEKLAALVHALDVGGVIPPEAAGFEAILTGARARLDNDDALLAEIGGVLDSLYTHYNKDKTK